MASTREELGRLDPSEEWRVEEGSAARLELVERAGRKVLRLAVSEPGTPCRVVRNAEIGEGSRNRSDRRRDLDLRIRFRWILRGDEYAWSLHWGEDDHAIAAGFESVRPPTPSPRGRARLRALASRGLALLGIGGRRLLPPAPPGRSVRLRLTGGIGRSRPFGTRGNHIGCREPDVGEWMWLRLTRMEGRHELRFWRDGFVEPEEPWVAVEATGANRSEDGSSPALGFLFAHGRQEMEIDRVILGTEGDRTPRVEAEHGGGAGWYDRRWRHRKRIVVPKAHFSEPLEDFPLFVRLSGDDEIRDAARPDGADILFTAADGVTKLPHERATHRRLLREQGVWTVWSDPRGLRHVGRRDCTYVTYYTVNRGWWISALDHGSGEWEHHRLRSHEASADGRWWDDHNNPAVTVRPDGRLVVAYNEHSTARAWVRISERPEDITAWGPEIPLTSEQEAGEEDPRYSYADLYTLPDGTLWRHYRPRDGYGISRPATFVTSDDGGETWSAPTRFFEVPTRTPYVITAHRDGRIDFFCNEAHPNEYHRASIFHFYYDHAGGTWHRSDGSLIGGPEALPIGVDDATLVYDGTTPAGEGWVHSVASNGEGRLAGLFVAYAGEKAGLPDSALVHEYWYARWDGRRWERHHIATDRGRLDSHANQKYYAGGGVVDPEDLDAVYLSLVDPSDDASHSRHVFRYVAADGGRSWSRSRVTRGEGRAAFRPFVPRNRHESLPVFWLHGDYVNYYEYSTALAAGNDVGPVLESEHYVRVPRIEPGRDLVVYVYYGHAEAPEQEEPDGVWPDDLLFRYRGSLGRQCLGPVATSGHEAVTIEVNASYATRRQVDPARAQPLLSNREPDGDGGILIGRRAGAFRPEVVLSRPGVATSFDDLELEVRDHVRAEDPARIGFMTVRLAGGDGVHAWLNGVRSRIAGSTTGPAAPPSSADLWSNASPHDFGAPPWTGWIRSLRIHGSALSDAWITLAQRAELDPCFAARLPEESVEPAAEGAVAAG